MKGLWQEDSFHLWSERDSTGGILNFGVKRGKELRILESEKTFLY